MGNSALSHRQWEIVNLLRSYKRMRVEELAEHFDVTTTTIRRELTQLKAADLISRSRGYAYIEEESVVSPFDVRCQAAAHEKFLLAKHAMKYIQPSDTILLDAGSTVYALAKEIASSDIPDLAIITYSLPIINITVPKYVTAVTGGMVDNATMSLVGPSAEESLNSVAANKLFLSATGVNLSLGLTVTSQLSMGMKKKMINRAMEVIALIDSTKWFLCGLNVFCKLQDVSRIITIRTKENAEILARMEQEGVCLDCIDL